MQTSGCKALTGQNCAAFGPYAELKSAGCIDQVERSLKLGIAVLIGMNRVVEQSAHLSVKAVRKFVKLFGMVNVVPEHVVEQGDALLLG